MHTTTISARFPHRPMSDNAVLAALISMGYEKSEMSGHGFRAMARTILDEVLQERPDLIDHQLHMLSAILSGESTIAPRIYRHAGK